MDVFADLPALAPNPKLEFTDARGCKQWLQLLPLINVAQSQFELREMMAEFNVAEMVPLERLRALELLRENVTLIQEESAKKYVNKPSPLFPGEQDLWAQTVELWLAMATGYLHVLKAARAGLPGVADFTALIHERVLRYQYFALREYSIIYAQRPAALFARMHGLYLFAEEGGYAEQRVKDSQYRLSDASSCMAAYVHALLLEAANPNMMSVKQIYWIDRLLERWSQHVALSKVPVPDLPFVALVMDLDGTRALQVANEVNGGNLRYVDSGRLGQSVKKRIKLLRQGDTPAQLGLGEEYTAAACESAMSYLYQQWCEAGGDRSFQRYQAQGQVYVACQIASIHCLITGKPFLPPERAEDMSGKAIRDMQMFGYVTEQTQMERAESAEFRTETWDILDQSAMGCRIGRQVRIGARVSHNQLFGIKVGAAPFNLGTIRWLQVGPEQLQVGLRLLPGIPVPVVIRATGLSPTGTNKYIPALLLPAVPALKSPESLVLPPGWFRPSRVVEQYAEPILRRMRITELLERGPDFERVAFEMIG